MPKISNWDNTDERGVKSWENTKTGQVIYIQDNQPLHQDGENPNFFEIKYYEPATDEDETLIQTAFSYGTSASRTEAKEAVRKRAVKYLESHPYGEPVAGRTGKEREEKDGRLGVSLEIQDIDGLVKMPVIAEVVWEGGSGIDEDVANWWFLEGDRMVIEYTDGSTEAYPIGQITAIWNQVS